jgi:hypothetical protein
MGKEQGYGRFSDMAKANYMVDHRFYRNLHGRGFSLFQFCRLIALGLENRCKEASGRANTIHDVDDREKESGMVIDANGQPSLRGCAL